MIIRNIILNSILLFLFSCTSLDTGRELASIPTHPTCQNSIVKLIKKVNPAYDKNHLQLESEAEVAFSAFDFARVIYNFKQRNLKDSRLGSMLWLTPFAKEMDIPKSDLKKLANIINDKAITTKEAIKEEIINFFPAYKNGSKTFGKERDYDGLLNTLKAKNQCSFGSCWAYAQTGQVESQLSAALDTDIPLSAEHFYGEYILNEARRKLFKNSKPGKTLFSEGGWGYGYFAYLPHFGLMPEEAFKARKHYKTSANRQELLDQLRERINQFFQDKKSVNKSEVKQLRKKAGEDLQDIVQSYTGELRKEFTYKGQKYTPQSFYEEFFGRQNTPITNYVRGPPSSQKTVVDVSIATNEKTFEARKFYKQIRSRRDELEKVIIENIDKKKAVSLTMDVPVNSYFSLLKGGEVTVINAKTGKAELPGMRVKTRGGHVVVIVGYELDFNGKIKTVKIQNSWGDHGDEGFLHIDRGLFWKMMRELIVIN